MKTKLFLITYLVTLNIFSQATIDLNTAVQLALKNNLDLKIAENDAQISHNNNHSGNAGMLPNVSFNASGSPALTDINQKFTNGTTIERSNVLSNSANANVLATYTLFDGKRMYATRNRLEFQDQASSNALKASIQRTVSNVIIAYSSVLRHQEYMKVLKLLEESSAARLKLVEQRLSVGLANKTDLYLAQLDRESRLQAVNAQIALISNAFVNLNLLLNLKTDSTYVLQSIANGTKDYRKSELDSMINNNPEMAMAQNMLDIARQSQSEIAAARLPLVRLSGAYNYNISQSQAGFSLYNQGMGPQLGLTLSVPIFTGNVNKVNLENAKLSVESNEYRQEQTVQNIKGALNQAWADYSAAKLQLLSDSSAVKTADDYVELMNLRFAQGQNTIIELLESQRIYLETYYRYINNLFISKIAETQLLSLTGQLTRFY